MKMMMHGRGIPKELNVGSVGYNDRPDPLRENAQRMMKGDMGQVSKPYSPESASSPGNSKLTRGYKSGGHVKTGHRIPTDMHLPHEIDGHMPKKTPQNRMKKAGGVMQGDYGPGPSKREREVAVQGQKGPRLAVGGRLQSTASRQAPAHMDPMHGNHRIHARKGGDCYAEGGMPRHMSFGGKLKAAAKSTAKYGQSVGKSAVNAARPHLRNVAKMGVDYAKKEAGNAAQSYGTKKFGKEAGAELGHAARKATESAGTKVRKDANFAFGGALKADMRGAAKRVTGAAKSAARTVAPHTSKAAGLKKGGIGSKFKKFVTDNAARPVSWVAGKAAGLIPHVNGDWVEQKTRSGLETAGRALKKPLSTKVAAHGGHMVHKSFGGKLKAAAKSTAKYGQSVGKSAVNAARPHLSNVAKMGVDYAKKEAGNAAQSYGTKKFGKEAGAELGHAARKGTEAAGHKVRRDANFAQGGAQGRGLGSALKDLGSGVAKGLSVRKFFTSQVPAEKRTVKKKLTAGT